MVLINLAGSLVALPFVLVTGWPKAEAWPWLIASVIIHVGYYITLTSAYERADMGQVYPIARGSAPLLTATVGVLFLGEPVSAVGVAGIVILGSASSSCRCGAPRTRCTWTARRSSSRWRPP